MGRCIVPPRTTLPRAASAAFLAAALAVIGTVSSAAPEPVTTPGPAAAPAAPAAPAAAASVAPAGTGSQAAGPRSALAASTRANLLKAMHGESFARADVPGLRRRGPHGAGQAKAATLFAKTGRVERGDHFALEAELVGLAAPMPRTSPTPSPARATRRPRCTRQFAAQAKADGDTAAAAACSPRSPPTRPHHRDALTQAQAALSGRAQVPAVTEGDPGRRRRPARPARRARTLTNLQDAMRGEAFASAKYLLYAAHARSTGHPALAELLTTLSDVELREHWAAEAVAGRAGRQYHHQPGECRRHGENEEATTMYPDYAAQAKTAGDAQGGDAR